MRKNSSISEKFTIKNAKQKGYNNNYIHILDSVSLKSAFLVHARGTQGTLRYWNICDASFENGSSNIWNIDAKSDLTARFSYILWNWVILIHQRIMYLSNQANLELHFPHMSKKPFSHDAYHIIMFNYGFSRDINECTNQNGQVNYANEYNLVCYHRPHWFKSLLFSL